MSKKQNKNGLCASWATVWAMVSWAIVKRGRALLTVIKWSEYYILWKWFFSIIYFISFIRNIQRKILQKRNIIFCFTMWSLWIWIARFRLHSVSLLQAMRWTEYASPICCSSQLWLNGIPQLRLTHIRIKSLYGLLPHSSPAVVFFDGGIRASGI